MKNLCILALSVFFSVVFGANDENTELKVIHFLPGGMFGIYEKGQMAEFSLMLDSRKAGTVDIGYDIVDYYDKKCSSAKFRKKLDALGKTEIKIQIPPQKKYGHFTIDASIFLNGKLAAITQSAFAVLPPGPEKNDPYFELDGRNPHYGIDLLPAFKRLGVGTIALTDFANAKDPALFIRKFFEKKREYSDENVVAYIGLPGPGFNAKKMRDRLAQNLFPYTEEDYEVFEESLRKIMKEANGRIKFWDVVQEVDGWMMRSDISPAAVMEDHIIRVKRFSKVARELAPGATLAVMNSCGEDYFHNDFRVTRMLLKETASCVDYFSIDGYSGHWDGALGPLKWPEISNKFKNLMVSSIKLAAEFGMRTGIFQVERGYFVPYSDALNSSRCHDWANMNIRSIIIARTIPGIKRYSLHGACMYYLPHKIRYNKVNPDKLSDNGMWRSVYDASGRYALQPRPGVCAYATVTRMLSFVSDPHEIRISRDIHSAHFKRPDGKRVIAVWTTGEETDAILDFPVAAEVTDLMGNTEKLAKGKRPITISQSPRFLVVPLKAEDASALMKKIFLPNLTAFKTSVESVGPGVYDMTIKSFYNRDLQLKIMTSQGQSAPARIALKAGGTAKFRITGVPGKVELNAEGRKVTVMVPTAEFNDLPDEIKNISAEKMIAVSGTQFSLYKNGKKFKDEESHSPVSLTWIPGKGAKFKLPVIFATFNRTERKSINRLKVKKVNPNEKYNWYKIGTGVLGKDSILYITDWHIYVELAKFYKEGASNKYEFWISAKIQGPAFVKDSKKENAVIVDRALLIEK